MIDAVVNTLTGPALVHDERDLEGARAFLLGPTGSCGVERLDGTRRALARGLDPDMAAAFRSVDAVPMIRLDGARVASQASIRVRLVE